MKIPYRHLHCFLIPILAAAMIGGLAGCSSVSNQPQSAEKTSSSKLAKSEEPDPQINSIGTQSILTFDKNIAPEAAGIVIPVEGFGMDGTIKDGIYLQISGTVPLASTDYSWNLAPQKSERREGNTPDLAEIVLKGSYVRRLRTGDRLEVLIGLKRPGQNTIAYAHRPFTVYELEDYRKQVVPNRVAPHDIQAFPLPEEETRFLFGGTIARSYFVVRLTLRNSQGEDKLVNTGMIAATGRAIVVPVEKGQPNFTVPVKVSPQGPVQVFAVLDDQETWRPRAWIFRSLEFAGTLATAGVNSFSSSVSSEWKKITSLYAGVFVPEARKFWPDGWPGFKRNLVTFSMPELTKIPRQSTTSPKYVFFAKRDLELIVSDPTLFQRANIPFLDLRTDKLPSKGPEVRVISLAFDNLEIPFEHVSTPGTEDNVEFLNRVETAVDHQIERLQSLAHEWEGQVFVIPTVKYADLEKAASLLTDVAAKPDMDLQAANLQPAIKSLAWLAAELVKTKNNTGSVSDLLFHDGDLNGYGLRSLSARKDELQATMRRLLANSESRPLHDRLDKIQQSTDASEALIQFVESAVNLLTSKPVLDAAAHLQNALPKAADPSPDRDVLQRTFATLKNGLNVPVLKDFSSPVTTAPSR